MNEWMNYRNELMKIPCQLSVINSLAVVSDFWCLRVGNGVLAFSRSERERRQKN